jgi:hypothetical protein
MNIEMLVALAALSVVSVVAIAVVVIRSRAKRLIELAPLLGVVTSREDSYGPLSTKKEDK